MVEFVSYTALNRDPEANIQIDEAPTLTFPTISRVDSYTPTDSEDTSETVPTLSWYNSKASTAEPSTNGVVAGVIQYAADHLGKNNYKYGATGENGTYDCSGLIYKAYQSQGVSVPRSTVGWLSSNKTKIDAYEGQPGDVIITSSSQSGSGNHARLITKNLGNGQYECIEAKGKNEGIVTSTYTVNSKLKAIYRAKRGLKLIKKPKYEQSK